MDKDLGDNLVEPDSVVSIYFNYLLINSSLIEFLYNLLRIYHTLCETNFQGIIFTVQNQLIGSKSLCKISNFL